MSSQTLKECRQSPNFPRPEGTTDVRAFLFLANQLGPFPSRPCTKYMYDTATSDQRRQLSSGWTEHQKAFENVKAILTSPKIVQFFDTSKSTELLMDASKLRGLGFALMQEGQEGK